MMAAGIEKRIVIQPILPFSVLYHYDGRMQNAQRRSRSIRTLIWIAAILVALTFVALGVSAAVLVFGMLHVMDSTGAHVCGLAAVRRSSEAARLLGAPIAQRGLTGGSFSSANGQVTESVRFTVGGPLGTAYVLSEGHRSPIDSHLEVKMGRDQRSTTIYSGPFDCPELHRAAR